MLFMITQVHSPESCPKDEGGSDTLVNKAAEGIVLKGRWGAWSAHTVWYLVEAESQEALQRFLDPGLKRSTCSVSPVGEAPIVR